MAVSAKKLCAEWRRNVKTARGKISTLPRGERRTAFRVALGLVHRRFLESEHNWKKGKTPEEHFKTHLADSLARLKQFIREVDR